MTVEIKKSGHTIEVTGTKAYTVDDVKDVSKVIDEVFAEGHKCRLLWNISNIEGLPWKAVIADLSNMKQISKIEIAAMVINKEKMGLLNHMLQISMPVVSLLGLKMRLFDASELEQANAYIAGIEPPADATKAQETKNVAQEKSEQAQEDKPDDDEKAA